MQIYSNHRYKCNIIYRPTCKMRINVRFAMIHHCFAGEAARLLAAFLQMTACEFAQVQDSVTFLFSPEGRRLVSCTSNALDKLDISHHFATKFWSTARGWGCWSWSRFNLSFHAKPLLFNSYSMLFVLQVPGGLRDWDWCFCWNSEFLNAARSFSWEGTIQWPKPKEQCSRRQSVNDSREHTWKSYQGLGSQMYMV